MLEWHCLQEAKKSGRCITANGNSASRPYTPAPLEADCHEVYDTARTLLSTLGYPPSALFGHRSEEFQQESLGRQCFDALIDNCNKLVVVTPTVLTNRAGCNLAL